MVAGAGIEPTGQATYEAALGTNTLPAKKTLAATLLLRLEAQYRTELRRGPVRSNSK